MIGIRDETKGGKAGVVRTTDAQKKTNAGGGKRENGMVMYQR
jgi:hypothetical protein